MDQGDFSLICPSQHDNPSFTYRYLIIQYYIKHLTIRIKLTKKMDIIPRYGVTCLYSAYLHASNSTNFAFLSTFLQERLILKYFVIYEGGGSPETESEALSKLYETHLNSSTFLMTMVASRVDRHHLKQLFLGNILRLLAYLSFTNFLL